MTGCHQQSVPYVDVVTMGNPLMSAHLHRRFMVTLRYAIVALIARTNVLWISKSRQPLS